MNKKVLFASSAAAIMFSLSALTASAAGLGLHASSTVSVSLDTSARAKADAAITARVSALDNLKIRVGQMQKVSVSEKTSLDATIDLAIGEMNTLKAKIDADTDNATLKADIQSITKSYRIYLLVMPQGRITAAADRIETIVSLFSTLSGKLLTRMTAAQAAGNDITAENTAYADMTAKMQDANVQASAAITEVASLQPDNGDKTVFASNQAALKDARSKIKTAAADLKAARADAGSIVKALLALKPSASASATTTAQ